MKTVRYLDKKTSLTRAVKALYKELGPAEMIRVTATHKGKRDDSVTLHRKLQSSLTDEQCLKEVLDAYSKK